MDLVKDLKLVLEKLTSAFSNKNEPEEIFLGYVDSYLFALEEWQKRYAEIISNENAKSIDAYSDLVSELRLKHQDLMEMITISRDEVGEELAGMNNRAKVIKRYIDVLPARVSVTRGKKG